MKFFATLMALTASSCAMGQTQSQYGPSRVPSYGSYSPQGYDTQSYQNYYYTPQSFVAVPEPAATTSVGAGFPFMPSMGGMGGMGPMGGMGYRWPFGSARPAAMPYGGGMMPYGGGRPMGGGMMGGGMGGGIPFMGGLGSICNFPMHSEFAMPPWCMDHPYPF